MSVKPARTGSWQDGENDIAKVLGGIRTGNKPGHKADVKVERANGKTLLLEIKNCEGRLY